VETSDIVLLASAILSTLAFLATVPSLIRTRLWARDLMRRPLGSPCRGPAPDAEARSLRLGILSAVFFLLTMILWAMFFQMGAFH
jgi:hypothetical protein